MAQPQQADGSGPGAFRIAYGVVKALAIVVGGALTIPSLMALVGLVTENGWIRLGVALLVALGVPLLVADRLLPDDDPSKGKGLPSDVLALGWLGFALLFVGIAGPWTGGWLWQESDRLEAGGMGAVATGVRWIAGPPPARQDEGGGAGPDGEAKGATDGGEGGAEPEAGEGGDGAAADEASADNADAGAGAGASDGGEDAPGGDADTGDEDAMTASEIFRRWAPSVVSVQVGRGGGTGFIIGSDGTIATNHHVVKTATGVQVKLYDGTWADEVWLLEEDEEHDLALLRVETDTEIEPVALGDSDEVQVGEAAIAIGNPLGLEHTLTDGIVSSRRVWRGRKMIQMSTPVSPGNSGGPLFDAHGEVIGINTATIGAFGIGQNLNLAVPVNTLKALLEDDYPDAKKVGGGGGAAGRW